MVSAYNTDMFSFPMDEFKSWMLVILAQMHKFQGQFFKIVLRICPNVAQTNCKWGWSL